MHFRNCLSFSMVVFECVCETTSELHLNKREKKPQTPPSIISEQTSLPDNVTV